MATRTIANGGGNWDAIGTWVEGAVPVAGDAVVATATSGDVTVNVASACATIILTGYVGTLTFDSTLTVTSTVTFVAGMTIAGTAGTLILNTGGQTVTTGGKTLTCGVTFGAAATYTLGDALAFSGTLTFAGGGAQTVAGAALSGTGAVAVTTTTALTLNNTGGLVTTGTLTLPNAAVSFAGTAGFTVGTLTNTSYTASRTVTLTFGNTYTVTAALANVGTTAAVVQSVVSGTPGSKVVFNLDQAATCDLLYCNPTDVNSDGGRPVVTARGTITTSTNWVTAAALTGRVGGGGRPNMGV